MSNAAIDWAEQQPTGSSGARQLLVTLGNAVSDQPSTSKFGRKWPAFHAYLSIASLCERTLQDRKTVMVNLKRLEDGGFIRRVGTDGATNQTVVFRLSIEGRAVPEPAPVPKAEPVPKLVSAQVPEPAPVPNLELVPDSNITGTVFSDDQYRFSPSPVPKLGHGSREIPKEPKKEQESVQTRSKPKSRISEDWQLSEKLKAWTLAEKPGLQIDKVLANFRDHHIAMGEARADWDASWRTWVRRERVPAQAHGRGAYAHVGTDQRNYEEGFDAVTR